MNLIEIQNQLIPGYKDLQPQDIADFKKTAMGKEFIDYTKAYHTEINNVSTVLTVLDYMFRGCDIQRDSAELELEENHQAWLQKYQTNSEYQALLQKIAESTINKLSRRTEELARFFPVLAPTSAELIDAYKQYKESEAFNPEQIELEFLTHLIANDLKQVSDTIAKWHSEEELEAFNKEQARILAQSIISDFDKGYPFPCSNLFRKYKEQLLKFTYAKWVCVHGLQRNIDPSASQYFSNALSNLIWNNTLVNQTSKFINQLGEAHAFLNNAGFSAQNDSIIITLLELNNVNRVKEDVHEAKSIFGKILSPFRPLYQELKDITLFEKNPIRIFLRTIIPMTLIVGLVVGVSMLMAPLFVPEVVTAVIIIPVLLYAGLALASAYASVKNDVYNYLRQRYYGGPLEIPEFQINQRMLQSFKTRDQAQAIRSYYVEELRKCDDLEHNFKILEQNNILGKEQINDRQQNNKRRCALFLEWYDIHSNAQVGFDEVPELVKKRLNADIDHEFTLMKSVWQTQDAPPLDKVINQSIARVEPRYDPSRSRYTTTNSLRFFRPRCLEHKVVAERLDDLVMQIDHMIPSP